MRNVSEYFIHNAKTEKDQTQTNSTKHKQIPHCNITILHQGRQKQKGNYFARKDKNLSIQLTWEKKIFYRYFFKNNLILFISFYKLPHILDFVVLPL